MVRGGRSVPDPIAEDKGHHEDKEEDKSAKPQQVSEASLAVAAIVVEDEPGEEEGVEDVEAEVAVEVAPEPLPLEPEEAGDDGVLQQVPMVLHGGGIANCTKSSIKSPVCSGSGSLRIRRFSDEP